MQNYELFRRSSLLLNGEKFIRYSKYITISLWLISIAANCVIIINIYIHFEHDWEWVSNSLETCLSALLFQLQRFLIVNYPGSLIISLDRNNCELPWGFLFFFVSKKYLAEYLSLNVPSGVVVASAQWVRSAIKIKKEKRGIS